MSTIAEDRSTHDRQLKKVVVGVDGSEHSLRALGWAARQAAAMNVPLEVITVWTFPEEPAPLGIEVHVPWQDELMAEARAKLNEIIDGVIPDEDRPLLTAKVIRGRPAKELLAASEEDDLLVVGSRGRGAAEGLLFGSVCDRCVRHARCPVVVVR